MHRRGIVFYTLGRFQAALEDAQARVVVLRARGRSTLDGSRA